MKQNVPPVKGIIFDLDGTLYRMKWYMKGLITLRLFPQCMLLPRYMSVRSAFAGKDLGSGENLIRALSESLAKKTNGRNAQDMRNWIYDGFYRQFESVMPLMRGRRDGLPGMLGQLKRKGVKLAVLSDYGRIAERLRGLGIDPESFDALESAEEAGALKPNARPFIEIAQTWKLDTANILVVGDRDDTDGEAARQAEMQFLKISDKPNAAPPSMQWSAIMSQIASLVG